MRTRLQRLTMTVILTGLVAVAVVGCIAVPIPGPDSAYGPPAPVVVVPAPVFGYYGNGYYGGYHRGGYRRW